MWIVNMIDVDDRVLILLSVLYAFIGIVCLIRYKKRGRLVFEKAKQSDLYGQCEEACFWYAFSLLKGYNPSECKVRIREIWKSKGPFTFVAQLEKKDFGSGYEFYNESIRQKLIKFIGIIVRN
ncbi:MAG: hypothetical protein P4M13_09720 [Alphaproteobacteria bacterium]|nr:hypothetical protein [Alphaproteobacteria bacterium]